MVFVDEYRNRIFVDGSPDTFARHVRDVGALELAHLGI